MYILIYFVFVIFFYMLFRKALEDEDTGWDGVLVKAVLALFWPITIILFLLYFIKTYTKHKEPPKWL